MEGDPDNLLKLMGIALGGGLTVKLLDIGYQELRRRFDHRRATARQFVNDSLDPILKAADELFGKLRSIGVDGFTSLRNRTSSVDSYRDFLSLLFLLAQLWANLEIFRHRGLSVSVEQDRRGRRLIAFVHCLESRKVRIVPRSSQRAVGELMLVRRDDRFETIPFVEFVRRFETDAEVQRWVAPIAEILDGTEHTSNRQRLLVYGVIVHCMIDTLDPRHHVTRPRDPYARILSKRSWRDLKYRVFAEYLTFVSKPEKYLGPPKRRS